MVTAAVEREYRQIEKFWEDRYTLGDSPAFVAQAATLELIVGKRVDATKYYPRALELGCGRGRMLPTLAKFCGHIDAVDMIEGLEAEVELKVPNATYIKTDSQTYLPFRSERFSFMLACHTFQHIVSEAVFVNLTAAVRKVMKPGARVLIIDNAVDRAGHIKFRTPDLFVRHLGLAPAPHIERLSINKPNDHWLIDGFVK